MTVQGEWLTVREAASYLRIGRATLYRWARQGRVKLHKLGPRSTRIKRSELEQGPAPSRGWYDEPWTALSGPGFAKDWDNEVDAVYDKWRELYGVREG